MPLTGAFDVSNSHFLAFVKRKKLSWTYSCVLLCLCKTFGDRAFYKAGPDLWNHLPLSLRNTNDLQKFKKDLKTHLLRVAFSEH